VAADATGVDGIAGIAAGAAAGIAGTVAAGEIEVRRRRLHQPVRLLIMPKP
jgi:hypothetical protein